MPPCGANRRRPSGPRDARRPDRGTLDPAGRRSGARGQGQKTGRRNGRALRGGAGGGLRGRAKSRPRWGGFCIRAALLCTPGGFPARRGRPRPVSLKAPSVSAGAAARRTRPPSPTTAHMCRRGRRVGAHKRRQKAATKSGERARVLCARRRKPGQRHPASAGRRSLRDGGAPRKRRFAARPIFGRRSPVIGWPRPKSGTLDPASAPHR